MGTHGKGWLFALFVLSLTACSEVVEEVNTETGETTTTSVIVAEDQATTTDEDVPVSEAIPVTDDDGDTLTYTLLTPPEHGSIALSDDGIATYTPDSHYFGDDQFVVDVSDGQTSDQSTITVTINPVNDAPLPTNGVFFGLEDAEVTGAVVASDIENDPLTFSVNTPPQNGALTMTADGLFVYTPVADFNGDDQFEFLASDGDLAAIGMVAITINPLNDAPQMADASAAGDEDTLISTSLNATDVDGDTLSFSVLDTPENGSVSISADGVYSYTPNANYFGVDQFQVTVIDGFGGSDSATISLTIHSVNDAPTVNNRTAAGDEDSTISDVITAVDAEGQAVSFSKQADPGNGSVTVEADGAFTYIPDPNFNGEDAFVVEASDGDASDLATITITVNPVNDAPVAENGAVSGNENSDLSGTVSFSNVDDDVVTVSKVSDPANGSLTLEATGRFVYVPNSDFVGNDAFEFQVSDGELSTQATMSLQVNSVNQAPVAENTTAEGNEDSAITGQVTATDPDEDELSFSQASAPSNGAVTVNTDGSFVYTPNANFSGEDAFQIAASDGELSAVADVAITVLAVNDAPQLTETQYEVGEDQALTGNLSANDPEDDEIRFVVVSEPENGLLIVEADGSFSYTPEENFAGEETFSIEVSDGEESSTSVITVVVTASNDAPQAPAEIAETAMPGETVEFELGASDVDGDDLQYSLTEPSLGEVSINASGVIRYTANEGLVPEQSDLFIVTTTDPSGASVSTEVTITLIAEADEGNYRARIRLSDERDLEHHCGISESHHGMQTVIWGNRNGLAVSGKIFGGGLGNKPEYHLVARQLDEYGEVLSEQAFAEGYGNQRHIEHHHLTQADLHTGFVEVALLVKEDDAFVEKASELSFFVELPALAEAWAHVFDNGHYHRRHQSLQRLLRRLGHIHAHHHEQHSSDGRYHAATHQAADLLTNYAGEHQISQFHASFDAVAHTESTLEVGRGAHYQLQIADTSQQFSWYAEQSEFCEPVLSQDKATIAQLTGRSCDAHPYAAGDTAYMALTDDEAGQRWLFPELVLGPYGGLHPRNVSTSAQWSIDDQATALAMEPLQAVLDDFVSKVVAAKEEMRATVAE